MREFTHRLSIDASPAAVLDAFFNHESLAVWWRVTRSLCQPRPFGAYSVEWDPTDWHDETLGRLGGAFHGTVIDFKKGREFFVAELYWLPPDGEPIGPMALEVSCTSQGHSTLLHVRQSGGDAGPRWTRYYEILGAGFRAALEDLKKHLE